jgi:protein-S-isoprenylcysteine O-methyltransferase Ste14
LKRIPFGAKPIIWTIGLATLLFSLIKMCLQSNTLSIPVWLTGVGWFLLAISLAMITMALFVNLPFRKTYVDTGVGDKLIKTGLYALVRHPGVYWVTAFFLSLAFISKSSLMLIAAPIFSTLNIALVIFQDRYFFVRMFKGYEQYQQETPMLIPNRRSIRAFVNSLRHSKANTHPGEVV